MKLAICICTYRRPKGLVHLLKSLEPLAQDTAFRIFVVDNHTAGEGLKAIATLQSQGYAVQIDGVESKHSGISQARNQVLQLAIESRAQFAALIDDDEWPSPEWLKELLRIQAIDDADAVGGPTRAVFEWEPCEQLKHSIYYGADLQLADNTPCTLEACGNVLLKLAPLEQLSQPYFDPDLGQSGGEDLQFFMRLRAAAFNMRWAKNATVFETVPTSRSSAAWLQNRVALIANSRVHIMQKLEPDTPAMLLRAIKTTALAGQSALYSALGLFNRQMQYQALIHRAKFHGKFQAHLGRRLERGENH